MGGGEPGGLDLRDILVRDGHAVPIGDGPLDVAEAVRCGVVSEDVLADLLAREAGSVVIDLDRGELETEAVVLLPGTVARRHLAVPVALDKGGQAVQVAFANPLDEAALTAVAKHTGRAVRALVGTFSAVRRALEREYHEPPPKTLVVDGRRRSELPPVSRASESPDHGASESAVESSSPAIPAESTRRFAEASLSGTSPLHRLVEEATPEQRIEALVLSLVDRGVLTHGDYEDALRRLLRRSGG